MNCVTNSPKSRLPTKHRPRLDLLLATSASSGTLGSDFAHRRLGQVPDWKVDIAQRAPIDAAEKIRLVTLHVKRTSQPQPKFAITIAIIACNTCIVARDDCIKAAPTRLAREDIKLDPLQQLGERGLRWNSVSECTLLHRTSGFGVVSLRKPSNSGSNTSCQYSLEKFTYFFF
jgi:hypothetical protein